jgi:hypothetical protein
MKQIYVQFDNKGYAQIEKLPIAEPVAPGDALIMHKNKLTKCELEDAEYIATEFKNNGLATVQAWKR